MDRVMACSESIHFHAPAKLFGPQAPVNEPLLIPDILQSARRRFARQRQYRRAPESSEAHLRQRSVRIERRIARAAGAAVVDSPIGISRIREIPVAQQI